MSSNSIGKVSPLWPQSDSETEVGKRFNADGIGGPSFRDPRSNQDEFPRGAARLPQAPFAKRPSATHTPVKRVSPEALGAILRVRGHPADGTTAADKPSWKAKVQGTLTRRQIAVTAGVPGAGRTINGPLRKGVPGQLHSGVGVPPRPIGHSILTDATAHGPRDPVLEDARDLLSVAEAMQASLGAPRVGVYEWPAISSVRKLVTKVVPWLSPAPLQNLATFAAHEKRNLPTPASLPEMSRDRARNAAHMFALVELLSSTRRTLDAALEEAARAKAAYEALPATWPSTTTDDTKELGPVGDRLAVAKRVQTTDAAVRAASNALREAIGSTDLMEALSLRHLSDQSDKTLALSLKRLGELKRRVFDVRSKSAARRTKIELAIAAASEESHTFESLGKDLTACETSVEQASQRLNWLSASVEALTAPRDDAIPADAAAKAAVLRSRIVLVRGTLDQAIDEQKRCHERLNRFADLNDEVSALLRERAVADQRWHIADRAIPPLLKISLALAERKAEADEIAKAGASLTPDGELMTDESREKEAIDSARQSVVHHLIEIANTFGAGKSLELEIELRALASRLAADKTPIPILPHTVLEIVTQSIANVGADASAAARMLGKLQRYPAAHWVSLAARKPEALVSGTHGGDAAKPSNAGSEGHALDADAALVIAFCRKLATLPRGSDLLHVLSSDGASAQHAARSEALRVFWTAEDAQQRELSSENGVVDWLQQAKNVARAKLISDEPDIVFDDVDHAAYNAVRNGYLSNASGSAYDKHNRRLTKATTEWVIRAGAQREHEVATKQSRWRRVMPNLGKTPFRRRVINRAYETGESMGLQSPRIKVDVAVRRRIDELERTLAASRKFRGPDAFQKEVIAAQAVIDHLMHLQAQGQHLSQIILTQKDGKAVSRRLGQDALERRRMQESAVDGRPDATRRPNKLRKAPPIEMPEFFQPLMTGGLTAYEALKRIEEHLNKTLPESLRRPENDDDANDLAAAIGLLKREYFSSKTDIVTFFGPFISASRLRDRLRIGGGGSLGANLPSLPYGSVSPVVSPIFTAEVSRTDEAYAQMFMPILGMELSFGSTHTRAKEATVGVAAGPEVAPGVWLQGTFSLRGSSQQTGTDSTVIRFFRQRHRDEEMRANMLNALQSMVCWDLIEPSRGRAYRDPLEAVFARNPAVVVSQLEGFTDTKTIGARISARLPSARFNDQHGVAQTLSLEASVYAEAEHTHDRRTETGGQTRIMNAKSDMAQQRAGATVNFNFAPLSNQTIAVDGGSQGEVQRESVPKQFGMSRDFAWVKAQHEMSPFLVGDKQDGDLDRHYATPTEMIAEIAGNRETWLARCIETLEPDATGEKDNSDNRLRAAVLLEAFEREIKSLGKASKYCHYNINYSMRGEAGAWIDGYRALAELASQRGDIEGVRKAQAAIDEVLLMGGTWRPLMLIVRERTRDSTSIGWRSLLRWQRVSNVDAQRTAAQFPPP